MNIILVTGFMGFIGSNLIINLRKKFNDIYIIGIDNYLSSTYNKKIDELVDYSINGSAEDDYILSLLDKFEINTIFHLATYHGNSTSILNPIEDHKHGAFTTLKLLEHFKEKKINRFIYSSAGCSMGTEDENKCKFIEEKESVSLKLDTPYQISKIIGELYCNFYNKEFNVPTVRARFQNVYGPGEILGAGIWRGSDATIWRNVIPIFIYNALLNEPLRITGTGEESRDFIFVDDICEGLIKCATIENISGDVFNISTGKSKTISDLAALICKLSGSSSDIVKVKAREWDNSFQRYASTEKSNKVLGFNAKIDLEEGLTETITWTKKNLSLIKKTIEKQKVMI